MFPFVRSPILRACALSLALLAVAAPAWATVTQTSSSQEAMTPMQAREQLEAGNQRFLKGQMLERDYAQQVAATAGGQYPFGVVLGCIDSRVPPEIVFDQGIGDIFAPRIAGNFVNTDILGSMEFATAVAGSKVIVVLGHTSCGAVKGAVDGVELGNLTEMLHKLTPAIEAVPDEMGERNAKNAEFVQAVADANVRLTIENILDRSPVMRELVEKGELMIVGAMHDVATGEVHWFDEIKRASR